MKLAIGVLVFALCGSWPLAAQVPLPGCGCGVSSSTVGCSCLEGLNKKTGKAENEPTACDGRRKIVGDLITLHPGGLLTRWIPDVDSTQLDFIFQNGGWPAFYKRFPDSPGILRLSRVGFDADATQALFYTSHTCGGLCAGGEYVVMERRDGRWVIEKEIEMWMS
jgi:hypothetical protein